MGANLNSDWEECVDTLLRALTVFAVLGSSGVVAEWLGYGRLVGQNLVAGLMLFWGVIYHLIQWRLRRRAKTKKAIIHDELT